MEREAVELAGHRLSQVHGLFDAGRVSTPDLRAAEQELLELKQRLQRHEQEVADARQAAAADGASRRG